MGCLFNPFLMSFSSILDPAVSQWTGGPSDLHTRESSHYEKKKKNGSIFVLPVPKLQLHSFGLAVELRCLCICLFLFKSKFVWKGEDFN